MHVVLSLVSAKREYIASLSCILPRGVHKYVTKRTLSCAVSSYTVDTVMQVHVCLLGNMLRFYNTAGATFRF
jgi:hypothetical protein